jgi:hypothetical protein
MHNDPDYQRIMFEAGSPPTGDTNMSNIYVTNYRYKEALTVTASAYNTKVSIEIPLDSTLNELLEVFKSVAISLGYHEMSWRTAIAQEHDNYRMDEESEDRLEQIKKSFTHESDC